MTRVIDKDKLITSMAWHDQQGMISRIDDVLDIIEAFPTLTPPNEWVSVEERMPEHMQDVIVLYGGGRIDIDLVDSLGDFRFDNLFGRVTHWMPLPAPPGKDNNVPINKPLTLEQLREMDGEPVWVELYRAWALVEVKQNGSIMFYGNSFSCPYSRTWKVYRFRPDRRPPEGEEDT